MNVKNGKDWRRRPIIIDGHPIYPLGFLIKDVLLTEGEANPYGIYQRAREMKATHAEMPQFKYSYSTIRTYFYWLRGLGFIGLSRTEPPSMPHLQDKRFYRLTSKGRKAEDEWFNVRETYQKKLGER